MISKCTLLSMSVEIILSSDYFFLDTLKDYTLICMKY